MQHTPVSPVKQQVEMPNLDLVAAQKILTDKFAPWVLATGIRVEATNSDSATLTVPFSDQLCRIGGIICGQALITGADTAMVIALAAAAGGFKPCTTVDLTINYMRPITSADARLEAKVMRLGKSLAFCTTDIIDAESGKIAAFATGTYAILG
jgi:uncharacterized protein (TIGR00369 family)